MEVPAGVVVVVPAIDVRGVVAEVEDDAMTELDSVEELSSGRIATGCVPLTLAEASRRIMLTTIRPFNMSVVQLE